MKTSARTKAILGIGAMSLLVLAAAAAWRSMSLAESLDVNSVVLWLGSLKHNPRAPYIVIAAFLIGSQIMFPITVLILATAYTFGPWQGFIYGMVGSVSGALLTYTIGYFLGHDTFRHLAGRRFESVDRALCEKGLTAVITTHLIPFGPFTIVNLSAGVIHVRPRDFILGSAIGLLPGVALTAIFEHQLEDALRKPEMTTLILLLASALLIVAGIIWVRRQVKSRVKAKYNDNQCVELFTESKPPRRVITDDGRDDLQSGRTRKIVHPERQSESRRD